MNNSFFITGTGTGVGKTLVSALLISAARSFNISLRYFKPIQTGDESDCDTIKALTEISETELARPVYALKKPAAPYRAALEENITLNPDLILQTWGRYNHNAYIIEGAGGLLVPITKDFLIVDLVRDLNIPVLIVASTILGTINHTLLTIEAARARKIRIKGIILSGPRDPGLKETITDFSAVPVLAEIPQLESFENFGTIARQFFSFEGDKLGVVDGDYSSRKATPRNDRHTEKFALRNDRQTEKIATHSDRYIWHPFTQHGIEQEAIFVKSAQGSWLTLENDKKILDAISSWWVNLHGHTHPGITTAIYEQAQQCEQVVFAGFTHEPAIALAQKLIIAAQQRDTSLARCFYSDNGSTAVEIALKLAYQYHQNRGDFQRTKFIALENSYHGDTLGCMAVSARNGFHENFNQLLPPVDFVPVDDITILENLLAKSSEQYAALILEPIVQGSTGMRIYSADYLQQVASLCRSNNILLICDEVFTGFYRTGKLFAFEHAAIKPDFLCLGKGLSGGFLPLAVTLTTETIFNAFQGNTREKAFLQGHSFTANPLGCAAALASWELLHSKETQQAIERISHQTAEWIQHLASHPNSLTTRSLGTIGAVEHTNFNIDYLANYKIRQFAIEKGVLLRPLGSVLYAVPPYCTSSTEIDLIYSTIESILDQLGDFCGNHPA